MHPAANHLSPLENALQALAVEDQLRTSWPHTGSGHYDELARQLARRLRNTSDNRKRRVWFALDIQRQQHEPTSAELVRIGVPVDIAIERVHRRAREFKLLCAHSWKWRLTDTDRYGSDWL